MRLHGQLNARLGSFTLQTGCFDLSLQGVTAVFGPSAAGKSSWLLALSGCLAQTQGQLLLDEQVLLNADYSMPCHQRGIGMVFQDAALFPHRDVAGNLRYAMQRSGVDQAQYARLVELTGLGDLLAMRVDQLSGGERQRVALARAILGRPRLLCLDEPLAALDWAARNSLLQLIENLASETGLPMIYVSHSALEVERLARQVVFMQQGRIVAVQSLQQTLADARSPLFEQDGAASVLLGRAGPTDDFGLLRFHTQAGQQFVLLAAAGRQSGTRLRIRARDVSLARTEPRDISVLNRLPVRLLALHEQSAGRVLARLELNGGEQLLAEITAWSAQQLQLAAGDPLFALIKSVALMD